jgi:2-methylaconitate cis-trans-isomerase PrpF
MGLGYVSQKVIPKLGVLAAPRDGGAISSRYLTPHALHAAHAVTGTVCVASACALKGSVSDGLAQMPEGDIRTVWIEHPSGKIDVRLEASGSGPSFKVERAGVLRTVRPIMRGAVLVPRTVFPATRWHLKQPVVSAGLPEAR